MTGGLRIEGHLQLTDGEHNIDITAEGTRLHAEIGNMATDPSSMQRVGVNMNVARRLSQDLDARELTLVITRNGTLLAELGAGVRSGLLARLFGFSRLNLPKRR